MNSSAQTAAQRQELLARLFPDGVPTLWCPMITHYRSDGAIDGGRMAAHLKHLSPYIKGFLIPGSTGDGWELDAEEVRQLLEIALDQCEKLRLHLLIGMLWSGADRVASSGLKLGRVVLLRGAEGDYARWLKAAGGPYDGFLLSTANCFGRELHQMTQDLLAGRVDAAKELADRLTAAVNEVFG